MVLSERKLSANALNAAKARKQRKRNAALRAAQDSVVLAKAARVVRAGIELGLLTLADLDGPIVPESP